MALLGSVAAALLLQGCASSVSGLGGSDKFACSAPSGVACMSVSGISENINHNTLPGLSPGVQKGDPVFMGGMEPVKSVPMGQQPVGYYAGQRTYMAPVDQLSAPRVGQTVNIQGGVPATVFDVPNSGTPLRSPEQVIRIWVAPYEDADGDLHDQRYVYLTLNHGGWQMDAIRGAAVRRDQYQRVTINGGPKDTPGQQDQQRQTPNDAAQDVLRGNMNRPQ